MPYKTILVHLDSSAQCIERVAIARAIAHQETAHLIGLAPSGIAVGVGESLAAPAVEIARVQANLDQAAEGAIELFEEHCRSHGSESFEARRVTESAIEAVLYAARFSDLVIIGQTPPITGHSSTANQGFVEHVLLGTGRPVLVVPKHTPPPQVGQRIVCAWDNSAEAARAVSDALPLLKGASLVEIAIVADQGKRGHDSIKGAEFARFLQRHGVRAQIRELASSGDEVGNALLAHVRSSGADLLVMGGYGHSRIREWVLGGTTRTILKAMQAPVLMTH